MIVDLIKSLDNQEQKAMKEWLTSPLHNSNKLLAELYNALADHYHRLGIEPDPGAVLAKLEGNKQPDAARYRRLYHELLTSMEDCLAYLALRQDTWAYREQVLQQYRRRGLVKHQQKRINQYRKYASSKPWAATAQYRLSYQLEKAQYFLKASQSRKMVHNIDAQEKTLTNLFLAQRFRQACDTLSYQRQVRSELFAPLLEESMAYYANHPQTDEPGIHLFYLAALLYRDQDKGANTDRIFEELMEGIMLHIALFPSQDQRNLLILAINHCLRESNTGRLDYLPRTLTLYKLGLERKIFYNEAGYIGIFTFNNILGIALRLEEVDWAENFLQKNARRLPEDKREEVESLSRARLSFKRGDYNQTLGHLRTADYQDFIHHLTARVLQLKIYFERDDYNLLISHIRSTKSLLRRKNNLGYHQKNYLNIFSLAEKASKLPPGDKVAKRELGQKIQATDPCTEKDWLLRAVERNF
ncbi:hypothetical protein CEQ90_10170 [Lewinellaceae bacterium SD302]|nr:hypothetical protein CEQ90_10170 [Lewinellaceae bacterium SD302]